MVKLLDLPFRQICRMLELVSSEVWERLLHRISKGSPFASTPFHNFSLLTFLGQAHHHLIIHITFGHKWLASKLLQSPSKAGQHLNCYISTDEAKERPRRNPDITTPTITSIPWGDEAEVDGDINFPPQWAPSLSSFTTSPLQSGKLLDWPEVAVRHLVPMKSKMSQRRSAALALDNWHRQQVPNGEKPQWRQMRVRWHQYPISLWKKARFFLSLKSLTTCLFVVSSNNFFCRLNTNTQARACTDTNTQAQWLNLAFENSSSVPLLFAAYEFLWIYVQMLFSGFISNTRWPIGKQIDQTDWVHSANFSSFFFCISAIRGTVTEAACQAEFSSGKCLLRITQLQN